MKTKSGLQAVLEKWSRDGGDLSEALGELADIPIETKEDAISISHALKKVSFVNEQEKPQISSPCHTLTAFFQAVETGEAYRAFVEHGLPELRRILDEGLQAPEHREYELMFILKIFAAYQLKSDTGKILEVARSGFNAESYIWSEIFGIFDHEHEHWGILLAGLREPLPEKFIGVSYLDLANGHAMNGTIENHPFDSEPGIERLEQWLSDRNMDNFSYARSAAISLPFLNSEKRSGLMDLAREHPDPHVRLEWAWAAARLGETRGVEALKKMALDVNWSSFACEYLAELGYEREIPEAAREEDFQAMAEMAEWLSHPNEFGRPPDKIELFDSRVLFWPPTDDKRKLWLLTYTYDPREAGEEQDVGIGMVGSITFALFGETTATMSAVDVYGLHCAWELEVNEDPRVPETRSPETGLAILRQHNRDL